MFLRSILATALVLGLAAPHTLEAATKKSSKTSSSSSSAGRLATIGDGPLGPLVAAPDQQIFLNILGFAYGLPTIGYEHTVGADNSWTGQIGFRGQSGGGWAINYLGVVGSYRWWLAEHAKMQGIYVGPMGTLQTVNVSYDTTTWNGTNFVKRTDNTTSFIFGVGGEGGYQWVFPAHITASIGLNLGYYFGSLSLGSGAPSIPFGGFGSGLNGTVGYAF